MVGILNYEEMRLRQQEIEVKALVALLAHGKTSPVRWKAEKRLEEIAYPEDLAKDSNQEKII